MRANPETCVCPNLSGFAIFMGLTNRTCQSANFPGRVNYATLWPSSQTQDMGTVLLGLEGSTKEPLAVDDLRDLP